MNEWWRNEDSETDILANNFTKAIVSLKIIKALERGIHEWKRRGQENVIPSAIMKWEIHEMVQNIIIKFPKMREDWDAKTFDTI